MSWLVPTIAAVVFAASPPGTVIVQGAHPGDWTLLKPEPGSAGAVLKVDPDGSNPRWVQAPPVLQNGGELHVGDCFRVVRDGVAEKIRCP